MQMVANSGETLNSNYKSSQLQPRKAHHSTAVQSTLGIQAARHYGVPKVNSTNSNQSLPKSAAQGRLSVRTHQCRGCSPAACKAGRSQDDEGDLCTVVTTSGKLLPLQLGMDAPSSRFATCGVQSSMWVVTFQLAHTTI